MSIIESYWIFLKVKLLVRFLEIDTFAKKDIRGLTNKPIAQELDIYLFLIFCAFKRYGNILFIPCNVFPKASATHYNRHGREKQ